MPKVSLMEMRRMGIFEEIEQPEYVYHMTSREKAKQILADGKVKVFGDYICFFFDDPKWIPLYIYVFGYDHGHEYIGLDGRPKKNPPLVHEDTVVLKLKPRRKEPLVWYREVAKSLYTKDTEKEMGEGMTLERYEAMAYFMYRCRLCHYDNLAFRNDDIEVLELTEIEAKYPCEQHPDAVLKFIKDNQLEDEQAQYIEHIHDKMKRLGIWGKV